MKFYYPGCKPVKRNRHFYDEQIARLEKYAEGLDVNSEEWYNTMQNIATLDDQRNKVKASGLSGLDNAGKFLTGVGSVLGAGIGAAGLALTWETAKMAYADDAEMKMKNGNVWRIKDDYRSYYKK